MTLHFLHIGKTGGSAIKETLRPRAELNFLGHPHDVRLTDIPVGEQIFFSIRHPVDRFVSGFNSRLRRGRPRNDVAWSPGEAKAFSRFPTPTAIAEGLGSQHGEERAAAEAGMNEIMHARPLTYWLISPEVLASRSADITMIAHLPELERDFALLRRLRGWPDDLHLPQDPIRAHITPEGFDRSLSLAARRNLMAWYEEDLILYGAAQMVRSQIKSRIISTIRNC